MSEWSLPVIALLLVGYSAVSARLQRTMITQAMVFVAIGVLLSARVLRLIDSHASAEVTRYLAELTLTLLLFSDAVRVSVRSLRRAGDAMVPGRLLGIGLPLTIVAGTVAAIAVFPGLNLWVAAALATILAPTDAALGLPVVTNPRLPVRIRQGLNVESGLNDGVCVPPLIIFLTLATAEEGGAEIHPVRVVVEQIGYGILAGCVAGCLGAIIVRVLGGRGWIHPTWTQINGLATPLLAYGTAVALGGSGFIAAFIAGIAYRLVAGDAAEKATAFAEESGEMFNALTFLLFGAVMLVPAFPALDWRVLVYALLSLTVIRMVPVALAMLGSGMHFGSVLFIGWFGPRGLASIVFALIVVEEAGLPEQPMVIAVVTWTVTLSVVLHGVTASPGANLYADWHERRATRRPDVPESVPVTSHRVRDHSRAALSRM
jgi:NhaP-type Na+/H+ or K+/H+ antiporter